VIGAEIGSGRGLLAILPSFLSIGVIVLGKVLIEYFLEAKKMLTKPSLATVLKSALMIRLSLGTKKLI
jgi:hypothetical protein